MLPKDRKAIKQHERYSPIPARMTRGQSHGANAWNKSQAPGKNALQPCAR